MISPNLCKEYLMLTLLAMTLTFYFSHCINSFIVCCTIKLYIVAKNKGEHGPQKLCCCRVNAFKLYLILLMTSHDEIYISEFVLFINIIVLLFVKTAKQLLSIMIIMGRRNKRQSNSTLYLKNTPLFLAITREGIVGFS